MGMVMAFFFFLPLLIFPEKSLLLTLSANLHILKSLFTRHL